MEAAMDVIAQYGLAGLTLARVASRAGLTAAMVNFHFDSKDALLLETLSEVTQEFQSRLSRLMETPPDDPAAALEQFIDLHFDPDLTQSSRIAVWYAFMGAATAREDYLSVCTDSDRRFENVAAAFIADILGDGNDRRDAEAIALGLIGILECQWQDRLLTPKTFDESGAREICRRSLSIETMRHVTTASATSATARRICPMRCDISNLLDLGRQGC